MPQLVVATRNVGKARELATVARDAFGDNVASLEDVDASDFEPDEDGRTFRDNAIIKASGYAKHLNRYVLADDSGLMVDALDGAPGVFSARFAAVADAGEGDEANNQLLLRRLGRVADEHRTARFICVLALSDPAGRVTHTTYGDISGTILREPRGTNGFGYDPLFFVKKLAKTTAELSPEEKKAISHRGDAGRRLAALLRDFPLPPCD
jgi:XTP/dITP diphosphohydrolase